MSNDVAILLDLDNAVIGAAEANLTFDINLLLEYVKKLTGGRIVFRRSYGDWRQHQSLPKQLAAAGFEMQTTVNQMSKNLADMQMVVDAMETLIEGHDFETYVLVTGDRDFMPIVQALRRRGKVVIGIGVKHTTSRNLSNLCDKYVFYEDIVTGMQLQDEQVTELLQQSLTELLADRDRVPASALKQKLQDNSNNGFGQSRHGKISFTRFLEDHADLVTLIREDTTVYVAKPGQVAPDAVEAPPPVPEALSEKEMTALLREALRETLNGHERIRASVLKEALRQLSQGRFDESAQGAASFSTLLRKYPDVVELQQTGSTLYVTAAREPIPGEASRSVAAEPRELSPEDYQRYLKGQGIRVVPARLRLLILKEIVSRLQAADEMKWRDLVDQIYAAFAHDDSLSVSKSLIHDALHAAERATVIVADMGGRGFTTAAPIRLRLQSERPFQDAVMRCDAIYLRTLRALDPTLDLEMASLALYDAPGYARYLKIVLSHYGQNGSAAP